MCSLVVASHKILPEVGLQGSEVQCVIIDKSDEIVTGAGTLVPKAVHYRGVVPGGAMAPAPLNFDRSVKVQTL